MRFIEGYQKMHFLHHREYTLFFIHNWTGYFGHFCSENHTEYKNIHVWKKRTLLIVGGRGT
jgi:hypothetical protein